MTIYLSSIRKVKHSPNCRAVQAVREGMWNSVWAVPVLEWAGSSAEKGKRNQVAWLKFICNSTNCKAELWVKEESVLKNLPRT